MTSELDSKRPGPAERARNRQFYVQVWLAVGLTVLLATTPGLLRRFGGPEALQIAAAFLPLLPMAWAALILIRFVRRSDEWEQRVYLAAGSVGLLAALAVAIVLNTLFLVGVSLPLGGWWAVILAGSLTMFVAIWVQSSRSER